MPGLSRRDFLRLSLRTTALSAALGAALGATPSTRLEAGAAHLMSAQAETPTLPAIEAPEVTLAQQVSAAVGNRAIGVDLRRIADDGREVWRVQVNASQLYPVASCFKTFAVLYYCWHMPYLLWSSPDEESPLYQIAVYSANAPVDRLLDEVGERIRSTTERNSIELFNDFLVRTLGLRNGLHRWRWQPGAGDDATSQTAVPVARDMRFAPSQTRCVRVGGECFLMDNLFTPADLADGYARLLAEDPFPDVDRAATAIAVVRALFSIPAEGYESPIERAFGLGYMGKDGVLPASDSAVGRVINDAGFVQLAGGGYVIAFMCVAGEFVARQVLGEIAAHLVAYDATHTAADQAGSS